MRRVIKRAWSPSVTYFLPVLFFLGTCTSDNSLATLCQLNAAKGDQADKAITALCMSVPEANPPTETCKPLPPISNSLENQNVSLADRLAMGVTQMQPGLHKSSSAVFILGNTGSGKTTLTQILTGNLSQLYATEVTSGGSMVIFDEENRIGPPTTVSKTVVPEFVVSLDTQTGIWDCPGFDDTRGHEVDIAAMYFLKTALDSTSQAKFLFTVSASSVTPGNDRLDFDLLAKHATHLLKDLTLAENSIGLVVTKVPSYSTSGRYRTDTMIFNQISQFLQTYVETLEAKINETSGNTQDTVYARKLQFVQIILGSTTTEPKIAFVRTPTKCGSLNEIPSIGETKVMVTKLYHEKLKYSPVSPTNFQVALKTETILKITAEIIPQLVKEIKVAVVIDAAYVWSQLRSFFDNLVQTGKIENVVKTLAEINDEFEDVLDDFKSTSKFSNSLSELFEGTSTPKLAEIAEMEKQLRFFQQVSNTKVQIPDDSWMEPLRSMGKTLDDLEYFYEFCQTLNTELGSYSKQVILNKLQKSGISFVVSASTLDILAQHGVVQVPTEIQIMWKNGLTTVDKRVLTRLVISHIPSTQLSCVRSLRKRWRYRLQVSGQSVKFSDFVESQSSWPYPCSNPERMDEISVLASNTVFFDSDLEANCKRFHVSVLAPKWVVVKDNFRIFLGCLNRPQNFLQANSGSGYGNSGADGRNGLPGTNGGSFFGAFLQLEASQMLRIYTSGGNGGNGQLGGHGASGRSGTDATYSKFPSAYKGYDEMKEVLKMGFVNSNGNLDDSDCLFALMYLKCWLSLLGGSGGRGGDGGRGGNGGLPGNAGNVLIISTPSTNLDAKIGIEASTGLPGVPERGGNGGKGGRGGQHYSCKHNVVIPTYTAWWDRCYSTSNNEYGANGNDGPTGNYPVGMTIKEKPYEIRKIVSEYKDMFSGNQLSLSLVSEIENSPKFREIL